MKSNFEYFRHRERRQFFFEKKNQKFIFRVDDFIDDHVFIFRRLCISNVVVKNVLKIVHDDSKNHSKYAKLLEIVLEMSRDSLNEINVVAKRACKDFLAHIQIVNQLSLQSHYCIFAYFT